MKPNIIYRRAQRSDISHITALRWEMCREQGIAQPEDQVPYEQELCLFLEQHLPHEHCQIWLAEVQQQPIATATVWFFPVLPRPGVLHDKIGYVSNVFTLPSFRCQGIATQLMHCLAQVAQKYGASELMLEASPEATPLYQHLGYENSDLYYLHVTQSEKDK